MLSFHTCKKGHYINHKGEEVMSPANKEIDVMIALMKQKRLQQWQQILDTMNDKLEPNELAARNKDKEIQDLKLELATLTDKADAIKLRLECLEKSRTYVDCKELMRMYGEGTYTVEIEPSVIGGVPVLRRKRWIIFNEEFYTTTEERNTFAQIIQLVENYDQAFLSIATV